MLIFAVCNFIMPVALYVGARAVVTYTAGVVATLVFISKAATASLIAAMFCVGVVVVFATVAVAAFVIVPWVGLR